MIKKIAKIMMVLFMVFGIAFSIINFIPNNAEASTRPLGSFFDDECLEPGSDCDIGTNSFTR